MTYLSGKQVAELSGRSHANIVTIIAVLLFSLLYVGSAQATVYNVMSYGAAGNGTTDDTAAIQATINAAANAGSGNEVLIPADRYYLGSGYNSGVIFNIPSNAVNLIVTGVAGQTLLFTSGGRQLFQTSGCTNCTIENFNLDYQTVNETQGVITSVNTTSKTATVTIDSGYAAPNASIFTANSSYTPNLFPLTPGRLTYNWQWQATINSVSQSGSSWVISLASTPSTAEVGTRFFIWGNEQAPWTPMVVITNDNGLTVQNINDYAGGGFAVNGSTGTLTFTNWYCGPPPGTTRLGFYGGHQGHARAAMNMTNCSMLMSNDDDMNDLTPLDHILAHPQANVIQITPSTDYEAGDIVSIWDYTNANAPYVRESSTITGTSTDPDGNEDLTLSANVTIVNVGPGDPVPNAWTDGIDRVVDLSSGGPVQLINCAFNSSFAHPLLIKTATSLYIKGCQIYGSDMSGLCSGMQTYWNEGPQSENVTLLNNQFYDVDGISCEIGIEDPNGISSGSHDFQNIVVENNVFRDGGNHAVWNGIMPQGVGLLIGDADNATVTNNVFEGFPNANLAIYSTVYAVVTGNVFENAHQTNPSSNNWPSSVDCNQGSTVWINDSSSVSLANNVDVDEGPYSTTLVGTGSSVSNVKGANSGVTIASPNIYYAASGALVNCSVASGGGSASGKYVTGMSASNSSDTLTVTVPEPGLYPVIVAYDNDSNVDQGNIAAASTQEVIVNGQTGSPYTIDYPYTGAWGSFSPGYISSVYVELNAGTNTIEFLYDTNRVELDNISIPVNQGASPLDYYKLYNNNSGLVLAIVNASTAAGADVQQYTDNGTPDHNWRFLYSGAGQFRIYNQNSGLVLAVASTAQGAQTIQTTDNGAATNLWHLVSAGGGYYNIINYNTGYLTDIANGSKAAGALSIQWIYNGTPNQQWRLQDVRSGTIYQIGNNNSGLALTPIPGQTANGADLTQESNNGAADLNWELEDQGYGVYKLLNTNSGSEAGIVGASLDAGVDAIIWGPNGAPDHLWELQDSGSGYYTLVNWNSDLVLGINGESKSAGAQIFQTPENFTPDHIWSLL